MPLSSVVPKTRRRSCGRASNRLAKGWRGLLGREDDDTVTFVVLCLDRVKEEFETEAERVDPYVTRNVPLIVLACGSQRKV